MPLGGAEPRRGIKAHSRSEAASVFTEVKDGEEIPKGFGHLTIRADIKTPLEGYYLLESRESMHGKQGYLFLLNIDGQAVVWEADGVRDNRPAYDNDGRTSRDPEARDGMKYTLEKTLRLAAGPHNIFLGLPGEDYAIEKEIMVREGKTEIMEYRPVYKYKTLPTRIPTFLRGIKEYAVLLNGKRLP